MYTTAIVRKPGLNCVEGLTSVDLGRPDPALLLEQYNRYVDVLKDLGLTVIELDPHRACPDAYFVEDVAVVVSQTAIITRPGAASRRAETESMASVLRRYRQCEHIHSPGTLDGGDVLIIDRHCIIGLSERTNHHGARQLGHILARYGYDIDIVEVPDALHLKSSVNFIDQKTLIMTQACLGIECLAKYQHVVVPPAEQYAANVVWVNGTLLMPAGYSQTRALLTEQGSRVLGLAVSEIAKMDGGLTCLSLRLD